MCGSSAVHGNFTNHSGKIKIMFSDCSYYEGQYKDHMREGFGTHYYPNGDKYDGAWSDDGRVGRGKLFFSNGSHYFGQFMSDAADGGAGAVETKEKTIFKMVEQAGEEEVNGPHGCVSHTGHF